VEDGYYEVWMATPDASTMVAIGTLNPGEEAVLTLPAGMDTAAFPLVDVSVEHFDGDAGHSAVSVVRGQLPA
jgi:anti-sigma-K factor RskA